MASLHEDHNERKDADDLLNDIKSFLTHHEKEMNLQVVVVELHVFLVLV
jgi:hypothetical protein